jgi:Protein of unknown function (DUF4232)
MVHALRWWQASATSSRQEVDVQFTKDHRMGRFVGYALPAALAMALAACGGSSHSSSRAAAATPSNPPSTPATTPAVAVTTATTPTPAPTAGPGPCRAADLSLSYLGGQGATGHGELGFALRNTGSQTCNTYGYPGIQFLDRAGRPLTTVPSHTTQDFFGTLPKVPLTVAPGATVSFRLGVTHGITSSAGCATASALQVIPPNDTATLKTTIGNGGAYECQTATVSPIQRGTSAYP